jgi:hypothetical protein
VPDKVIQAILRHSNVAVTQACYIKTSDSDVVNAMQKLEHATNMQLEAKNNKLSWFRFFGQMLPFLKWRFCLLG